MIRAYRIPMLDGESVAEHHERVTSMNLTFDDDEHRNVVIHADGYVQIEGSIDGAEETAIREFGE